MDFGSRIKESGSLNLTIVAQKYGFGCQIVPSAMSCSFDAFPNAELRVVQTGICFAITFSFGGGPSLCISLSLYNLTSSR